MHDHGDLTELYEDQVLGEAESPYHKGRLEHPTLTGAARNPLCGDQIWLDLLLDDERRVTTACHDAQGCVISRAGASLLCRHVEGKSTSELRSMPPDEMLDLIGVPLSPVRQRCALLAYDCLQRMLKDAG